MKQNISKAKQKWKRDLRAKEFDGNRLVKAVILLANSVLLAKGQLPRMWEDK